MGQIVPEWNRGRLNWLTIYEERNDRRSNQYILALLLGSFIVVIISNYLARPSFLTTYHCDLISCSVGVYYHNVFATQQSRNHDCHRA